MSDEDIMRAFRIGQVHGETPVARGTVRVLVGGDVLHEGVEHAVSWAKRSVESWGGLLNLSVPLAAAWTSAVSRVVR